MQPGVRNLLRRRMDQRLLAKILGFKDKQVDPYLPEEVSDELRWVVLSECNSFLEFVLDVVESFDDGSCVVNEVFLEHLAAQVDDIHRTVAQQALADHA